MEKKITRRYNGFEFKSRQHVTINGKQRTVKMMKGNESFTDTTWELAKFEQDCSESGAVIDGVVISENNVGGPQVVKEFIRGRLRFANTPEARIEMLKSMQFDAAATIHAGNPLALYKIFNVILDMTIEAGGILP